MTQDIADIIAGELKVSRGTAYDMMREALAEAQPQQEPWEHLKQYGYAPGWYMNKCRKCGSTPIMDKRAITCRPCAEDLHKKQQEPVTTLFGTLPVYDTPAQRNPLTDEEIWKFWWSRPEVPEGEDDSMEAEFVAAVRAVLAAHGIN